VSDVLALRLLELVQTKLGAADARIEIGGEPPSDERCVWAEAGPHRRIVAVFGAPPDDRPAAQRQLQTLVDAFHDAAATPSPTAIRPSVPPIETRAALDAELAALCVATNARAALLIDSSSPVVWGRSHDLIPSSVEPLLEIGAAVDPTALGEALATGNLASAIGDEEMAARARRRLEEHDGDDDPAVLLLSARSAVEARALAEAEPNAVATMHRIEGQSSGFPMTVHGLAGVYLLVLAFDERFSELHVERAVRANKSRLERLIGSLPPIEPPPGKARVVRLKPR
jgi:hypothetical protein